MPEGDTIFRAARTLHRALAGSIVTGFETQLPALARVDTDQPIAGRTVEFARATGKWLQIGFSGDLVLLDAHADERKLAHLPSRRGVAKEPLPYARRDRDSARLWRLRSTCRSRSFIPAAAWRAGRASASLAAMFWRMILIAARQCPPWPPSRSRNRSGAVEPENSGGIGEHLQVGGVLSGGRKSVPTHRKSFTAATGIARKHCPAGAHR